jgi:hypothetical protein
MSRQRMHIRLERQKTPESFWPEQQSATIPESVHEVLETRGQSLDSKARAFMEPRFRYDFSQIRIHSDEPAAESARDVNALAYTVGNDVVFGQGQYAPETQEGRRLLAHELTHVIQQKASTSRQPATIGKPGGMAEQEANTASSIITSPAMLHTLTIAQNAQSAEVQRQPHSNGEETQTATPPGQQQTEVTVQPPPEQHLSSDQVQALNQRHPPANVQANGSAPSNQQHQQPQTTAQNTQHQQTSAQPPFLRPLPHHSWHWGLEADSDPFQYKVTLNMEDFNWLRYRIGGNIELDILNQPNLEIDFSRSLVYPEEFAGAQAAANLVRLQFGRIADLALLQAGIGVDSQGHPVLQAGPEGHLYIGPITVTGTLMIQTDGVDVRVNSAVVRIGNTF